MKIDTTRFGTIDIDETKILHFVRGILGFPQDNRYVLLPFGENSPFFWLQSVDSPDLAFIVVHPSKVVSDYSFDLPDDIQDELELSSPSQADVLVIVTLRPGKEGGGPRMSVNLLGPIIINVDKALACQVALDHKRYPVRYEFSLRANPPVGSSK